MTERLPIYELEDGIVAALKDQPRLILSAPTGSGKSTQVPQILLRHGLLGRGQVAILQPRRLAARLLAARVARELGTPLGRDVGYQIRFETVASPQTRIRFVTEGILLRQMIQDPRLPGTAALIFDEFHERHLYGDITLARTLDLQQRERPDILIIIMSATLDLDALSAYLKPCALLRSEGRMHPIEIEYAPKSDAPVWEQAADAFARSPTADALIFMPGAFEIARTLDALRERPQSRGHLLLPLHGELLPADQDAAVARYERPKIVVATNVAETSLTIEGVRLVIDSGLARVPRYDPYRGINTLLVEKISRASADQRAGRAGRTSPGRCVRLWTEREHATRPLRELPEVKRLDLSEVVLAIKAAGIEDLREFRWLEPPDDKALSHAEELLGDLGALRGGALTGLGRRMLAFPLHPRYARMLLAAHDFECVREAALMAALTQGRDLLTRGSESLREGATSDFEVLRRAWEQARAVDFRVDACRTIGVHAHAARQVGPLLDQFLRIAEQEGLDVRPRDASKDALRKCILIGFSDRVARRLDEATLRCELVHGRRGTLARESAARGATLLVAAEVREVEGKKLDTILSLATAIEPAWLAELFAEDVSARTHTYYDAGTKRVYAEEQRLFRDLVLERRPVDPSADEAARILAEEVAAGRLKLNGWDVHVEQWILRRNLLARACPELGLGAMGEAERRRIVERICRGGFSHREIKDRPVMSVVRGELSPEQQALVEKHAPERLALSNGRTPKLTYAADGPPRLSAKIQDLFGVRQVPKVAMGRVAPVVEILAPNMRPVQVTQDLAAFWREHYPALRKDLQRRYPKHDWREA